MLQFTSVARGKRARHLGRRTERRCERSIKARSDVSWCCGDSGIAGTSSGGSSKRHDKALEGIWGGFWDVERSGRPSFKADAYGYAMPRNITYATTS